MQLFSPLTVSNQTKEQVYLIIVLHGFDELHFKEEITSVSSITH